MAIDGPALIERHLAKHDKSQRELAKEAGIAESHVSRYRRGLRTPGIEKAMALERATNGEVPAESWAPQEKRRRKAS